MATLTLSRITRLPELIPSIRGLQMAIEMYACEYGRIAMLESEADEAFDAAIEAGLPSAVRMDLAAHANMATELRQQAQRELDAVKRDLIVMWS